MSRIVRASIVFDFDIDEVEEAFDRVFTDEEANEYVLETFMEDLHTFMKYNEMSEIIKLETVHE